MRVVLDLTPAETEALAVFLGESDPMTAEEKRVIFGNAQDEAAFARAKRKVEEAAGWLKPRKSGRVQASKGPHLTPIDPSRLAGS